MSQSAVTKYLKILEEAEIVGYKKGGLWVNRYLTGCRVIVMAISGAKGQFYPTRTGHREILGDTDLSIYDLTVLNRRNT